MPYAANRAMPPKHSPFNPTRPYSIPHYHPTPLPQAPDATSEVWINIDIWQGSLGPPVIAENIVAAAMGHETHTPAFRVLYSESKPLPVCGNGLLEP